MANMRMLRMDVVSRKTPRFHHPNSDGALTGGSPGPLSAPIMNGASAKSLKLSRSCGGPARTGLSAPMFENLDQHADQVGGGRRRNPHRLIAAQGFGVEAGGEIRQRCHSEHAQPEQPGAQ